jgi:hypothetical protein
MTSFSFPLSFAEGFADFSFACVCKLDPLALHFRGYRSHPTFEGDFKDFPPSAAIH